jgi:hypothetical protein
VKEFTANRGFSLSRKNVHSLRLNICMVQNSWLGERVNLRLANYSASLSATLHSKELLEVRDSRGSKVLVPKKGKSP